MAKEKTQTFVEERIEQRAEDKLSKEYRKFFEYMFQSPFVECLKIGDVGLVRGDEKLFPEYYQHVEEGSELGKLLEERRQELIKEETDEVMRRIESIGYLFEQQQ